MDRLRHGGGLYRDGALAAARVLGAVVGQVKEMPADQIGGVVPTGARRRDRNPVVAQPLECGDARAGDSDRVTARSLGQCQLVAAVSARAGVRGGPVAILALAGVPE